MPRQPGRQRSTGVHQARYCQLGEGKDHPSLLCIATASHGALGALQGTTEHKGHPNMGECAKEGTGTERSEVQSFTGIDYMFILGLYCIPHSVMRHRAHMGHEPHSVLAPHPEPGIFCPSVFHLTSYNSPSPAPGRALSQHEGQDLPAKGLGIRSRPVCFIRQSHN